MYANIPPKFLTWWKLNELGPCGWVSVAAAPAADGRAARGEESEEKAVDIIFILPFPVASAIMLPPPRRPMMLSSRSGTVTKAKDPARAIMRGNAMTRSLGMRLIKEVLLDTEDISIDERGEVRNKFPKPTGSCLSSLTFVDECSLHCRLQD